jgi:ParB-like chromosome segregation protein Spo0J
MSTQKALFTPPKQVIEEINPGLLTTQKQRRDTVKISERLVKVPFDKVVVRKLNQKKSFNLREDFGDLEELATSIANYGLQKALEGDSLTTGEFVLNDGERRFRAISMLRERSPELLKKFEYVDFIINERSMTDEERLVSMLVSGNGKPYEPLEEAEGFRRLRDEHKMNLVRIHELTGKSVAYVEQRLILADASHEEKVEIRNGNIKPTTFVQLARKEPDPEVRLKRIKSFTSRGKRVKVKDIKNEPVIELCKDALGYIKRAQRKTNDGEALNLLIEAEAKINEIKKTVQG